MNTALSARPGWRGAPVLATAAVLAWTFAIGAELTGRAQWIHHHHVALDAPGVWASLALFLVAWQVHIAAMMLPSVLPMTALFNRLTACQPRPGLLRAAFLGGYLAVWTGFGLAALVGSALVDMAMQQSPWLMARPGLVAGTIVLVAGAFQFSDLKDRCLDQCRSPRSFLLNHYRRGLDGALGLGVRHGVFCLGCCWALMLVMFIVGIANLAWMTPLALLMIYEKVGRHGYRIARPAGAVLIALGIVIAMDPGWLPDVGAGH